MRRSRCSSPHRTTCARCAAAVTRRSPIAKWASTACGSRSPDADRADSSFGSRGARRGRGARCDGDRHQRSARSKRSSPRSSSGRGRPMGREKPMDHGEVTQHELLPVCACGGVERVQGRVPGARRRQGERAHLRRVHRRAVAPLDPRRSVLRVHHQAHDPISRRRTSSSPTSSARSCSPRSARCVWSVAPPTAARCVNSKPSWHGANRLRCSLKARVSRGRGSAPLRRRRVSRGEDGRADRAGGCRWERGHPPQGQVLPASATGSRWWWASRSSRRCSKDAPLPHGRDQAHRRAGGGAPACPHRCAPDRRVTARLAAIGVSAADSSRPGPA